MANTVIALKKSGTPSAVPSSLTFGELAINYADGVLYYKAANGTILPFTTETNSFGTINANGTLIVSDTTSDVFSLVPGNFINITGDGINDSITISANVKVVYDTANAAYVAANGASKVTMANTAPVSPGQGDFWWNSDLGRLFIYYDDGTSLQWVEATAMLGPDYGLVYDVANAAFEQANTSVAAGLAIVYDTANAAYIHANAAFAYANTISSDADEKANAAIITANAAYDKANAANVGVFDVANLLAIIQANVNFVNVEASAAFTTANLGFDAANSSFGAANAAFSKANLALANSTSTFAGDLTITGGLTLLSSNTINVGYSEIKSFIVLTSTITDQILDSFANTSGRAVFYKISANSGTDQHLTEINLIHNDSNTFISQYGDVITGNSLFTFTGTYLLGSVRLNVVPSFTNTTFNVLRTTNR